MSNPFRKGKNDQHTKHSLSRVLEGIFKVSSLFNLYIIPLMFKTTETIFVHYFFCIPVCQKKLMIKHYSLRRLVSKHLSFYIIFVMTLSGCVPHIKLHYVLD